MLMIMVIIIEEGGEKRNAHYSYLDRKSMMMMI